MASKRSNSSAFSDSNTIVEGNLWNPFDCLPIEKQIFDQLYNIGISSRIGRNGDSRFRIETLPEISDTTKERQWQQFYQSRLQAKVPIPKTATVVTLTRNKIPKQMTYYQRYNLLIKQGYRGTAVDLPSTKGKAITDIVSYGPYFSYPHKDELAIGGIVSLPSFIPSNVIKLWIFSASTVVNIDALMNFRLPTLKDDYQTKVNDICRYILSLVRDKLAIVIIQRRGETFQFEGGHNHAVITAFEHQPGIVPLCVMHTQFDFKNAIIAHSYRMLNESLKSKSMKEYRARLQQFNRIFSKKQIKTYKKLTSKSVIKKKATDAVKMTKRMAKKLQLADALRIRHSRR